MRIYSVAVNDQLVSAHLLLDRIKSGQLKDGFNPRDDINRKGWTGLDSGGVIDAGLDLLAKYEYIKIVSEPTAGRPKSTVRINPHLTRQKVTEV